jgi:hypothetical protein
MGSSLARPDAARWRKCVIAAGAAWSGTQPELDGWSSAPTGSRPGRDSSSVSNRRSTSRAPGFHLDGGFTPECPQSKDLHIIGEDRLIDDLDYSGLFTVGYV